MIRPIHFLPAPTLPSPSSEHAPTAPPEASPTLQTLLATSAHPDVPLWRDRLAEICANHPALSASLRLFLSDVALTEIALFLDSGVDVLIEALDANPELADGILASWETALAHRHPADSLEAIGLRVTSASNLRDIQRSMARAEARDGESSDLRTPTTGKSWAQGISEAFQWLRMAGTGFDPNATEPDYEQRARDLAREVSRAAPTFHFGGCGALGALTGLLYAYANTTRTISEIQIASGLPAPHRTSPDKTEETSSRHVISSAIEACLNAASEGASQWTSAILSYDPLRFRAVAGAEVETMPSGTHAGPLDDASGHRSHHWRHMRHVRHARHPPLRDATRLNHQNRSPLNDSPATRRAVALATALKNRARTHDEIANALFPVFDLPNFISNELAAATVDAGVTYEPELLYLNRCQYFGRPSRLNLPPDTVARSGLIESLRLSDAALQFFTGQNSIKETPLEYGIYVHNRTRENHYVPEDEFPGMSVEAFGTLIDTCRHQWINDLDRLEDTQSVVIYEHTRTALDQDASIEYNAGRISGDGLLLAQIAAHAPDGLQRESQSDTSLGNVKGHAIYIDIPGKGHVRPAGAFAISEYPAHMTRHPGRILVAVLGSGFPLREYESEQSLERDLARGSASVIYRELVSRLPLDVQSDCLNHIPCLVMLPVTTDNLIEMAQKASFDAIRRDFEQSSPNLINGQRTTVWTTWLAGANATTFDTGMREAAPGDTGFANGFAPDVLPRNRRLQIDQGAMDAVREVGRLRARIAATLPDVSRATQDYMSALIRTLSGRFVSPSHTYLHVYKERLSSVLNRPAVDWSGPNDPIETSSLTQYLANMVSGRQTEALTPGTIAIFSNDANPVGAHKLRIPNLTPTKLLRAIDVNAFVTQQTEAFDAFWREHSQDMFVSLKGAFIIEAFVQQQEGRLRPEAADIARRVAGCADMHSLDLDSMHTKSTPAKDIRMSWLHIGVAKTDIQILKDVKTGWILVYAPRVLSDQVIAFDHHIKLHQWLSELLKDSSARERLVSAFSKADRETAQRTGLVGVNVPRMNTFTGFSFSTSPIDGDPFTAYLHLFRERWTEETHNPSPAPSDGVLSPLLNTLAAANFIFGIASIAGAAVPGVGVASATLSAITFGLGATAIAFGDAPVRNAGWNAMLSGAGGLPLGWYVDAGNAVRVQLQPFLAPITTQRLKQLMPNLYRGEHGMVARSGDHFFNVDYFPERGSWRVVDSASPQVQGPAVLQTSTYDWVIQDISSPGTPERLKSGSIFHEDVSQNFIDVEYRSKCSAQRHAASARHRDAFQAGRTEARQSQLSLPAKARHSDLLKLDFIDPTISDPRLLGILSRRVEEAMRVEATALAALNAQLIAEEFRAAFGEFRSLPQMAYTASNADGNAGFCLPLVRSMAVAQRQGSTTSFIETLEHAIRSPQSPQALELRQRLIRLHSSVEANAAETMLGLSDLRQLEDTIKAGPTRATYLVSTRTHSMSIMVEPTETFVYDPNFGIGKFSTVGDALKAFGALMRRGSLARRYGAFDLVGEKLFVLKQLNVAHLAEVDVGGKKVMEMVASGSS